MAWQDQGRQYHMWFGHGKAPQTPGATPGDADHIDGGSPEERAAALVYGAIASLPPSQRRLAEAQLHRGTLSDLTETLTLWMRSANLDATTFANRFFGRRADDLAVVNLHGAVIHARLAPDHAEMRAASGRLAAAMTAVGLDRWPRFVAAAQERAIQVAADLPDVTPVPLVDDDGHAILTPQEKPIFRPAGMDPHFFVARGLKDRETEDAMVAGGSIMGAVGYEFGALANFNRWARWDAQRVGGRFHREFVDYATIAIGLYAAACGIPRDEILSIQNLRATDSRYDGNVEFDKTYTHLPRDNVANTDLGYELYRSGRITVKQPT